MMKLRFIGKYTGAETITLLGVTFVGREPVEVSGEAAIRLARHPEFEEVNEASVEYPAMRVTVTKPHEISPKRRGRKPKAAQ